MVSPLFYNSLTKKIEALVLQEPGKVRIYNCGPTVYKRQHVGNMRRFLFSDFLRRSLEFLGYEVREITNITDVGHLTQDEIDAGEDKMARAAREQKVTPQMIAEAQTNLFLQDLTTLNIQPAHKYPRASQHIPQMHAIITTLLEKKHAYQTASGIYFDVQSFPDYGKLSGNTLANLSAGARVEVRHDKKHPADFALWVFDTTSLQQWDSPWGVGYPGWHIECSAMSLEYLGSGIDIHTGGEDNRFPHHENEIAQSEAATGSLFVHTWMHNRHLQLGGVKMAKREGESITLDTITERDFDPLAFRLLVFASHYRQKIDFSWESLTTFQEHFNSLVALLHRLRPLTSSEAAQKQEPDQKVVEEFAAALRDDLNTPVAWATFLGLVRHINAQLDQAASPEIATVALSTLLKLDHVLGVTLLLWQRSSANETPEEIQQLVMQREAARQAKNFTEADRLRSLIDAQGYLVKDSPSGPQIVKK